MNLTTDQVILILGVIATIVAAFISWYAAMWVQKRDRRQLRLSYTMSLESIISKRGLGLEIRYKGELLRNPTLLSVDIRNTGNVAIENPPIEIEVRGGSQGGYFVMPGRIENIPSGYDSLWESEQINKQVCALRLAHINPGQIVKARFLLHGRLYEKPKVKCPMMNLEIKEITRSFPWV